MIPALVAAFARDSAPDASAERAAAAGCELLDGEFRAFVLDAESAIDRGDLDLTREVVVQVTQKVPCLKFAPEPRIWADFMVVTAIVAYEDGQDWQSPLAAALRIRPAIDRVVGRGHPMYGWEPPIEPAWAPLPASLPGQQVLVDGRLAEGLPPDRGWYLVQRTDGRFWDTYWLKNAPPSETWWTTEVPQPPRIRGWVAGGLHVGGMRPQQTPQGGGWEVFIPSNPDDPKRFSRFWDVPASGVPGWGVNGHTRITFFSPFGVAIRGSTFWNNTPGLRDLRLSGIWESRSFVMGVGLTFTDVIWRKTTRPMNIWPLTADWVDRYRPEWTTRLERYYHVELGYRRGTRFVTELGLVFSLRSVGSWSVLTDAHVTLPGKGGLRPRIGGQVSNTCGLLEIVEADDRQLLACVTRTSGTLGVLFGELR
jgi:hypothetical protein